MLGRAIRRPAKPVVHFLRGDGLANVPYCRLGEARHRYDAWAIATVYRPIDEPKARVDCLGCVRFVETHLDLMPSHWAFIVAGLARWHNARQSAVLAVPTLTPGRHSRVEKAMVEQDPTTALAETTATYDREAADFLAYQWQTDFGPYIERFLAAVPPAPGLIIDAGCGTGHDVAALVARGYATLGVDLSSAELKVAAEVVLDPLASWLVADLRDIPLAAGAARGIWSMAALLHLDPAGKRAALAEFRRLLVPGGALFLSTVAGGAHSARVSRAGNRRHFWGTDLVTISASLVELGFEVVWSQTEQGLNISSEWVNVLAVVAKR